MYEKLWAMQFKLNLPAHHSTWPIFFRGIASVMKNQKVIVIHSLISLVDGSDVRQYVCFCTFLKKYLILNLRIRLFFSHNCNSQSFRHGYLF